MNSGLKLRWRRLTRDEIMYGNGLGSVMVRVSEHDLVPCVLEFMADGQTQKDFWEPVEMVRGSPASGGTAGEGTGPVPDGMVWDGEKWSQSDRGADHGK
jgi:hypothetical protein